MTGLSRWLEGLSTLQVLLLVAAVVLGVSVLAAVVGWVLVRMGMKRPRVVERASRLAERVLALVKVPLTIVVLDQVTAVVQTGHYTKNVSDALKENHDELKQLVAEKVREDPNVRLIGKLPGYDRIVGEASEMTMRVIIAMLQDPRMDELVNDLLRNNINQIKQAVRMNAHENLPPMSPPDPVPPRLRRR